MPAAPATARARTVRPWRSSIHLAKDGIDRAHDRDDVGDLVAGNDVRQDREVRERRAAPLHAVRLRGAVADHVAAHLAARPFDASVGLALRNPDLRYRLELGPRRGWSR